MAGLGAPDTSHLSVAVMPSVTVASAGSWVKAGATSGEEVTGRAGAGPRRDCPRGLPQGWALGDRLHRDGEGARSCPPPSSCRGTRLRTWSPAGDAEGGALMPRCLLDGHANIDCAALYFLPVRGFNLKKAPFATPYAHKS